MSRRSKKKRTPSTAAERLRAGRRAMTVEDLHALDALGLGDDVDLDRLASTMAEADALIADYTNFRKVLPAIDAVLAQDEDNLPARRPSSPAERRRQWQEREMALHDAYRSSTR